MRRKENQSMGTHESKPMKQVLNAHADYSDDAMFIHSIGRSTVEAQDITALKADVRSLFLSSREMALRVMGKVTFIFEGWNNDKRELCEIPEVRSYVAKMVRAIPVFFLCDDLTLLLFHNCHCDVKVSDHSSGMKQIYFVRIQPSFSEFVTNGFNLMNECYERYGLSEEANKSFTYSLTDLFQGKRKWDDAA